MSPGPLVTTLMALISRERAAREAAEREAREAHFLSEASALLAESLDYDTVLGRLARRYPPRWDTRQPTGRVTAPVNRCW